LIIAKASIFCNFGALHQVIGVIILVFIYAKVPEMAPSFNASGIKQASKQSIKTSSKEKETSYEH
jgi:hypothetical protein